MHACGLLSSAGDTGENAMPVMESRRGVVCIARGVGAAHTAATDADGRQRTEAPTARRARTRSDAARIGTMD